MASNKKIVVFGAYGHTGRFVVAEILRRGSTPILSGRNVGKLGEMALEYSGLEVRPASIDDAQSLDAAMAGASAVINCAGPFLDTAGPVIDAALRAGIHYLDVTAEQPSARAVFEKFGKPALEAGIVIMPAMAFYGGLADLLATAAMGDWDAADEIRIAVGLDSWKPTVGTRLTGERNTARRVEVSNGKLEFLPAPPPDNPPWDFPAPFGKQDVVSLPLAEIITISRHLQVPEVHSVINAAPLADLRDPSTPEPVAADESGRSDQLFVMDVIVRKEQEQRRATASGRDIYAITAPLVVEAATRILDGRCSTLGAVAPGEAFDTLDFLQALSPEYLSLEIVNKGFR